MSISGSGQPRPSSARTPWLALAVVLFLLQALPYLSDRWLPDDSWYAATGYSIATGQGVTNLAFAPNEFQRHFDPRPPGTALVASAAFRVFGPSEWAARLGSILAGVAIVILTYRLALAVLGELAAVLAAFLVASDNLIWLSARSVRPEALVTMMVLFAMAAMLGYQRKGRFYWTVLSGVLMGLGLTVHISPIGYILSLGLLAIVIDYQRQRFLLRGALGYTAGFFLGLTPFLFWILRAPLGKQGLRGEYLGRAASVTLWNKFLGEGLRYSDLMGFNMLHGHGLEALPVRCFIPLLILFASLLLFKLHRRWFYLELLLLLPTMLWFLYTINKTSRYTTLIAPIFALALAAAVAAASKHRRLQRGLVYCCWLVVIAQVGANLYLLRAARQANYPAVTAALRSMIPAGETAYGNITYWMALYDHPYISYERTDPQMAVRDFHARYFISGDHVLVHGLAGDQPFYENLRKQISTVTDHSTLVGQFSDPYYGDLRVYRLPEP